MAEFPQEPEKIVVRPDMECQGSSLRVLGWMLLAFDLIIAVYVLIGLREGSTLWLWWTLAEGGLGLLLVGIGSHLRTRSMAQISRDAGAESMERKPTARERVEDSGTKAA
jgi:hypothetical protein